jgi:hypothetical protein
MTRQSGYWVFWMVLFLVVVYQVFKNGERLLGWARAANDILFR